MTSLVLIVEDEQKIRDLVRRYLEREGYVVLSTGSGAEAITIAADARPGPCGPGPRSPGCVGNRGGARGARGRGHSNRDADCAVR